MQHNGLRRARYGPFKLNILRKLEDPCAGALRIGRTCQPSGTKHNHESGIARDGNIAILSLMVDLRNLEIGTY